MPAVLRGRFLLLTVLVAVSACAPQRSFVGEITQATGAAGPTFDPSMKIVYGLSGKITIRNPLDKPHGFSIEELRIEEVVPSGGSVTVALKGLQPVDYQYFCQLHDVVGGKGKHQRGVLRVAR